MSDCLVAFGSNVGDGSAIFAQTEQSLADNPQIQSLCCSELFATQPVGGPHNQARFLNGCFRFQTDLPIDQLFQFLQTIEQKFGRKRMVRWGDRNVDLDLLLYGDRLWNQENLVVPHPRMTFRRFVLHPARQIAPEMIHPVSGLTVSDLIHHLDVRPDHIVAAVAEDAQWNPVTDALSVVCQAHHWEFHSVVDQTSFDEVADQAKLVLFGDGIEKELLMRACRFPGATLKLGRLDVGEAQTELKAAIQAMSEL